MKKKFFLTGLLLSLFLLWPLIAAPYFTSHDDVQVIRLHQMNECIKDLQIPCRWVPDLGNLYGYPLFNYYAPLPYYFGELIYLVSGSFLFSMKVMFALSFIGSFIFMYLFASKFWGGLGGSLSAIFYAFAPYHAFDFYVRGAMGEMWALMFFPLILLTLTNLANKVTVKNALFLSLALAGLILSHNLSTMIFIPVSLAWLMMLYLKDANIKLLLYTAMAVIFSLNLTAFYFIPMMAEKDLVHVETTTVGYFSYTEHFKGFKKLLGREWGYGASVREVPGGERDGLSYQIGWVHILGLLITCIMIPKLWHKDKKNILVILVSIGIILASAFMVNPRSEFIWKIFEPLKYVQFPWRFLMIVSFFISFIAGSIFVVVKKWPNRIWLSLVVLVVVSNLSYFQPGKFINISDSELLSGANWDRQIKRAIYDFLPIYASEPPADLASDRYKVLTGESRIFDYKKGSDWFTFKTETNTHTILRISQYYFPEWKILVDGKEAQVEYKNNSLGLMTIILGEGSHVIEAKLHNTVIRSISNLLTLFSSVIFLVVFMLQFKIIRGWASYYRKRMN